ncbi:MAG: hypothetical protein H0V92_11210 [Pseudonocardiales bacterium]|nr:hypothetical protein [Pseudonocardiales bacterium]
MGLLTAMLRQPAALGTGVRKAGVQASFDYITGSVLRGAFAARWIAAHQPPLIDNPRRAEFERLFEGGVVFGPLLPPDAVPMPRSCWTHKYPPRADCPLWFDEAVGQVIAPPHRCPVCDQPLRRGAGELRTVRDGALVDPVATVEDTHVAIDQHDRAQTGDLFTRRRIAKAQVFQGWLSGPADDLEAVCALGPTVWLGGRRSTSGQAAVTHEPRRPTPGPERLGDSTVILRLASPGLFVDEFAAPSSEPSSPELEAVLGKGAAITRRWVRWTQVAGWHAAGGLPKPAEAAVAPGATYLVQCNQRPTDEMLAALGARGLGLRRIEGYGSLCAGPDTVLGPLAIEPSQVVAS